MPATSSRWTFLLAALLLGASWTGCGDAATEPSGQDTLAPPSEHADSGSDHRVAGDGLPAGAPPSPPRDDANTIRWTTASEVSNYGYDIYRGDSPEGPFEKISEQPVEGAGTTDTPTRYEFVDDTIEPDREYYYYVESIAIDGTRTQFTPIRRAPPKSPTAAGSEAS